VQPYFPGNPFGALGGTVTPNASSAAWLAWDAKQGAPTFGAMFVQLAPMPSAQEIAFPVYMNHAGSNTPVKIHCAEPWGACNVEGLTIYIDPRELPQSGGCPATGGCAADNHFALIDPAGGYEYCLWQTQWPPVNGVLTVGFGGRAALAGNGFTNPSKPGTGCAGDASDTPLSLGLVRAKDWLAAIGSPSGVLPGAISYAFGCTGPGPLPPPFIGAGDGQCAGAPPEGSHLYLAMHDAQVNALGVAPLVAVLLRTMDEDHYGAIAIDSGGGPSSTIGPPNFESDKTYTAWGLPAPYLAQFVPEAVKEGLPTWVDATNNRRGFNLPFPSSVTWGSFVYAAH